MDIPRIPTYGKPVTSHQSTNKFRPSELPIKGNLPACPDQEPHRSGQFDLVQRYLLDQAFQEVPFNVNVPPRVGGAVSNMVCVWRDEEYGWRFRTKVDMKDFGEGVRAASRQKSGSFISACSCAMAMGKSVLVSSCSDRLEQKKGRIRVSDHVRKIRQAGRRVLKEEVRAALRSDDLERALEVLLKGPTMPIINTLFSLLLSHEPLIRWRAITAMGCAVARLAKEDIEAARVVVRRMIWQLNDESGGIGWGCPEAMGEVVARDPRLAAEYACILISYVREDANFLEYEPLRAGAVWAIGRVAQESPERVKDAVSHLLPSLGAKDPALRGLAVWALGHLRAKEAISKLITLQDDSTEVEIYEDRRVRPRPIKDLVREALEQIRDPS